MSTKNKFTKAQLSDWRAYERVRQGGRYNMFDPRARRLTGLSQEDYNFTLSKYSELQAVAEAKPRFVFVLWNNEMHDGSEVKGVYESEREAIENSDSRHQDIARVPFYEH